MEEIKHAAVKTTTGFICIGKCHADCFYQGRSMGFKMSSKSEDQGFMTNKGRYVDRKIAARIAKKANQIKPDGERKKVTYLLSEDIWYWDQIVYCPMRGYLKIVINNHKPQGEV